MPTYYTQRVRSRLCSTYPLHVFPEVNSGARDSRTVNSLYACVYLLQSNSSNESS